MNQTPFLPALGLATFLLAGLVYTSVMSWVAFGFIVFIEVTSFWVTCSTVCREDRMLINLTFGGYSQQSPV